jgi:hypothetical protein
MLPLSLEHASTDLLLILSFMMHREPCVVGSMWMGTTTMHRLAAWSSTSSDKLFAKVVSTAPSLAGAHHANSTCRRLRVKLTMAVGV